MQRLITSSTSRHGCTLIYLITLLGLAALLPAHGHPAQILLDGSMITVETGVGSADEAELVDEQASFPGGAASTSWENWGNLNYPQSVYLDLGQDYVITDVHLFNHGGDGDFQVSAGSPGDWDVFVTDPLAGYTGWENHSGLNVTTRYIRCTKTTSGKMAELVLMGYPAMPSDDWILTTTVIGEGWISRNPDLTVYPDGTRVAITAQAAAGYRFDHWENDLSGNGTVSPDSGTYEDGVFLNISATADTGWRFDHWEGDVDGNANPLALTMDTDKNLIAVFVEETTGEPQKIILSPAMVINDSGLGDAGLLVNEQDSYPGDASVADGDGWIPSWNPDDYPASAIIDLGKAYTLTQIALWDTGGEGVIIISAKFGSDWTALFSDGLSNYGHWNERGVNVTTRYIRVTKIDSAKMGEIVLVGYDADPGIPGGQLGDLKLASKTDNSVTLDWSGYPPPSAFDHYRIHRNGSLISTGLENRFTDGGLNTGEPYHYEVEAVDWTGAVHKLSNSLTATPGNDYNKISVITRGASISSSPTGSDDGYRCFDGNIYSYMATSGVNPAHVQVGFNEPQLISKLRAFLGLAGSGGDVNTWSVEAADSQSDLDAQSGSYTLAVPARANVSSAWDEAVLSSPLSRRIWRINVERTSGGSTVIIPEIEMYGFDVKRVKTDYKVVVIQYNPDIDTPEGTMPVETYFNQYHWQNWPLAADNLAGYIENFKRATGGLHDIQVEDHYILNEFPPVTDGTPLTPATFLNAYLGGNIDDIADYAAILNDPRFNIAAQVESGEVDGVFLIQCNSAHFNETRMAGNGAYYVNGGVVSGVNCKRKFVIYGFDYRGVVGGMAHMTGHMAEQTLARNIGPKFPVRWQRPVFTTYDLNDPARTTGLADLTDIKRFLLSDGANYSYLDEGTHVSYFSSPGNSEVGSIHFPPNGNQNYGYRPVFDWLVVDGSWTAGSSKDMTLTSPGAGVKVLAAPSGLGFIMGDGDIKAKVSVGANLAGAHAGLVIRVAQYSAGSNAMKGYYVGLDPAGDRVILARVDNAFTIIKTAPVNIEPDRFYTLRLKARGNRFDVYVSDMNVPLMTHYDSAFTHGTMGLCAYNTTAEFTYFDFKSTATNYSEGWYDYPQIANVSPITVGPETWEKWVEYDIHGGDFLFWWYEHLPKNTGIHSSTDLYGSTATGLLNTWLPLIFDINNFDGTAVYDAAFPPGDDQPPAPVANLQAAAVSSHVVELTWEEPIDNIGVTRYDVYRDATHIAQVASPMFTDTELTPGTTYGYTVMARDGFRNRSSASVTATTQDPRTYLSDIDWVTAINGFQTIGIDKANGGIKDLMLGGTRYAKGLGVHALSEITYDLGGAYQRFKTTVGALDGEWGCSVRFEVWCDGVKRFDSGPMYGETGPTTQIVDIDVDITGVNSMVIKVVPLYSSISGDHGVWAGARLE